MMMMANGKDGCARRITSQRTTTTNNFSLFSFASGQINGSARSWQRFLSAKLFSPSSCSSRCGGRNSVFLLTTSTSESKTFSFFRFSCLLEINEVARYATQSSSLSAIVGCFLWSFRILHHRAQLATSFRSVRPWKSFFIAFNSFWLQINRVEPLKRNQLNQARVGFDWFASFNWKFWCRCCCCLLPSQSGEEFLIISPPVNWGRKTIQLA